MASLTHVPIDVALALVTGRRIELPGHETLVDTLVATCIVDRPLATHEATSEALFEKLLRRAALAFPDIAGVTVAECDGSPRDQEWWAQWLAAQAGRYGDSIAFHPHRMCAEPL